MGAQRIQYQITGRIMNGTEVTGYTCTSDKGKQCKFTREQACYLAGRDQFVNAKGILSQGAVVLSGVGCELSKLPTIADPRAKEKSVSTGNNTTTTNANKSFDKMANIILNYINSHWANQGIKAEITTDTAEQKTIMVNARNNKNLFSEFFIQDDGIHYVVWSTNSDNPLKEMNNVTIKSTNAIDDLLKLAFGELKSNTQTTQTASATVEEKRLKASLRLAKVIEERGHGRLSVTDVRNTDGGCVLTINNKIEPDRHNSALVIVNNNTKVVNLQLVANGNSQNIDNMPVNQDLITKLVQWTA